MPRDLSKSEDMTAKSHRFSPISRRSSSETTSPPISPPLSEPAAFHSQVIEILTKKVENRELQLVSDAETLTADEGSDSSNDSWSSSDSFGSRDSWSSRDSFVSSDSFASHDSSGNIYLYGRPPAPRTPDIFRQFQSVGPKVVVEPIPQFDDEPMEIVVDEHPSPALQLQLFCRPPAAADAVEDEDDDDASETSSFWHSDEDEEIQRACLEESDEESDEAHDEPSSGRVHRPQVESPQYYIPINRNQPLSPGSAQQVQPYWPVDQLAPAIPHEQPAPVRGNNVELMDQDDQDSHYDQATNAILHRLPTRPIVQYGAQSQHHLVAARSPIHEREFNVSFSRYGMRPEPDWPGLNNNNVIADDYVPHPNNRCNHCGSPHQGMLNEYQQIELLHRIYLAQVEENRNRDFSAQYLLYTEKNQ